MPVSSHPYYKQRLLSWKGSPCLPGESCKVTLPDTSIEDNLNKPNIWASVQGTVPGRSVPVRDPNYLENTKWYPTNRPLRHSRWNYSRGNVAGSRNLGIPGSTIFRRRVACSNEAQCGVPITSSFAVKPNRTETCVTRDPVSGKSWCPVKGARQMATGGSGDKALSFNQTDTYSVSNSDYLYSRGKTYKQLEVPIITPLNVTNNLAQFDTPYLYNIECPSGQVINDRIQTFFRTQNPQFNANSAVASSTRIARLKYNAIACNYASQNIVVGPAFSSELTHGTVPTQVFLEKEKAFQCFKNSTKKPSGRSAFDCNNYKYEPPIDAMEKTCKIASEIARRVRAVT